MNLTGFKLAENGEDVMVRFVNNRAVPVVLKVEKNVWIKEIYRSNVIEEVGANLTEIENCCQMEIHPYEIATIGIRKF